jgi:glyoxylase-like metal-dependent hydrolase (beta-lactamase superfamily II)
VILVDTGYPGLLPRIRQAFADISVPFEKLSKVIITHHDIDHMGSLRAVINEVNSEVEIIAHQEERPYIQGELPPLKMSSKSNVQLDSLPEEQRRKIQAAFESFKNLTAKVDRTITDGEELPFCSGITVIHTPGHSPGHICLYLNQCKTLLAGDALFVEDGKLIVAPDSLNMDTRLAAASLNKLIQYDIEKIICCHGGLYTDNPKQRLTELTNEN